MPGGPLPHAIDRLARDEHVPEKDQQSFRSRDAHAFVIGRQRLLAELLREIRHRSPRVRTHADHPSRPRLKRLVVWLLLVPPPEANEQGEIPDRDD